MEASLAIAAQNQSVVSLDAATLPPLPVEAAIDSAVGVSLELAGSLAIFALIIFGLRKSFELSFGGKF